MNIKDGTQTTACTKGGSRLDTDLLHHKIIPHRTSKEWVVFLHGLGGSSAIWFKQMKEFRKHFNLLLIDLPGHGESKIGLKDQAEYSFQHIAKKVLIVLKHYGIHAAHFVGVSLGTIIVQFIQDLAPDRVKSMVLGGAVERIYPWIELLAKALAWIKYVIPYMWIYRLCAWVLMPKNHHKMARKVFVQEAVRLGHKEFFCWYKLLYREINPFFSRPVICNSTPVLYIMGSEDYMFLPIVKEHLSRWKNACLHILEKCGHVCNIEKDKEFNQLSVNFIYEQSMTAKPVLKQV